MKKRTFKEQMQYIFLWLFFLWVSCLCALLIDLLVLTVVKSIVVVPFEIEAILHVIVYMIGTAIPFAAISYMISYHLADFSLWNSLLEGLGAVLFQALAAVLFGFPVWISGGAKWLGGLMEYGKRLYNAKLLSDISLTNLFISFIIFSVTLLAVKLVAGMIGKNLRIRNRIALTGSPNVPSDDQVERE
jgi:hypothetical protein